MENYRKLLVAVVGLAVLIAARRGINLSAEAGLLVEIGLAALTAFGVYQVPNSPQAVV